MNKDYYEVLGISRDATDKEIKTAYRKLAKKYHPDANPGDKDAEKKFEEVGEAYSVLSDPKKRKIYDTYGSAAFDQAAGAGAGAGQGGFGGFGGFGNGQGGFTEGFSKDGKTYYRTYTGGDANMDDMFGDLFGSMFGHGAKGFDGSFHTGGQGFGGGTGYSQGFDGGQSYSQNGYSGQSGFGGFGGSTKGSDLTSEINLTFEEAAFGCDKTIRLQGADGVHTLDVKIPAGIDEGQSIRLRGKGSPSPVQGGEAGDLLLKVHVGAKEGFTRKGADIYVDTRIPFITAVLGGEARVHTLYGDVVLTIPAGTQCGSKIRLRGKGIANMKNPAEHGDEYAVIGIEVPTHLSEDAKEKLRDYDKASHRRGSFFAA
ncbi:MAG: DnaJ C-terminal domain-containing protein [Lachnospiraceae bacterium]|nr:DnaJ C-terminal domain-containing protein [Lachnospiraceae bacterium]